MFIDKIAAKLNITHPELAKQWHPTKNGDLKAEHVVASSSTKVWWRCEKKCPEGCPHEWEATIGNRAGLNHGCRVCARKQICVHTSISYTHPELAKQWHPTKNGDLKPDNVSAGSSKKIWWICDKKCPEGCLHEWEAIVAGRTAKNYGCSMCSNLKMCEHMSLKYTHPELAKQWHPTKNGNLKPTDIVAGTHRKIWWLCDKKCPEGCPHEWESNCERRAFRGDGCPNCSRKGKKDSYCKHEYLSYTHPELAKQWHPTKNGDLKPSDVLSGSEEYIWWICDKRCPEGCIHEWKSCIKMRTALNGGSGCAFCHSKQLCKHTSIECTHPEIAKQWHPTKNGNLKPSEVISGSHDKVWWLCPKSCSEGCPHEWESVVKSRTLLNAGCAVCDRKVICEHTSIKYTHPELAKQWHPTKNNEIKPSQFSAGSGQKVWWICPKKTKNKQHEWSSAISNRTGQNQGCNICKNKTEALLYDFLIIYYPSLIKGKKIESCKKQTYLPFDFCIEEHKIIIELDGAQHFRQVSNWKNSEITMKEDIFKMQKATKEGYKIIRISQEDVYSNNASWLEVNLLPELRSKDKNHIFISTDEYLYDEHIKLYNTDIDIML